MTSLSPGLQPDAGRVAELCRVARDSIQRKVGVAIDTSEESLAFVDHYIDEVHREGPIREEALALLAVMLGAHLGEVAIAKFGGRWLVPPAMMVGEGDVDDPTGWRVELLAAPLTFDPMGMAAEALRQGEIEGHDASFSTRPELAGPLAEALSRVEVTDEYYYSLTGRLETLSYVVDLLTEMARAPDEAPPDLAET